MTLTTRENSYFVAFFRAYFYIRDTSKLGFAVSVETGSAAEYTISLMYEYTTNLVRLKRLCRAVLKFTPCFVAILVIAVAAGFAAAQIKSQEVSDNDGVPVLLKHLPEWESVRNTALFTQNVDDLKRFAGERPELGVIEMKGGAEAVAAVYPAGKLVIVEFTSPQASAAADSAINEKLALFGQNGSTVYRRIGNYNAFVFDAADQAAANSLLDEIKYQKVIQWLGEDPHLLKRMERYFVSTTRDIFVATVLWITMGIGLSAVVGVAVGFVFFRIRDQKRSMRTAFSDAGGLTRLNLDELSE